MRWGRITPNRQGQTSHPRTESSPGQQLQERAPFLLPAERCPSHSGCPAAPCWACCAAPRPRRAAVLRRAGRAAPCCAPHPFERPAGPGSVGTPFSSPVLHQLPRFFSFFFSFFSPHTSPPLSTAARRCHRPRHRPPPSPGQHPPPPGDTGPPGTSRARPPRAAPAAGGWRESPQDSPDSVGGLLGAQAGGRGAPGLLGGSGACRRGNAVARRGRRSPGPAGRGGQCGRPAGRPQPGGWSGL